MQDHLSLQNSHRPPIFHRDLSPAGGEQGGAGDAGKEGLVGAGAGVEVVASTVLRGHHVVAFPDSTHTAPRGKVAPARLRGRAVCKVRRTAGQFVLHVGSSVAAAIVLYLPKLKSKV